jgi:methylenetetrahydrofolate--tRNA-(uracil-5-)-methyltransferase
MTMMRALFKFISNASPQYFQPMPPNFGIIPELPEKVHNKRERREQYRDRVLANLDQWTLSKFWADFPLSLLG